MIPDFTLEALNNGFGHFGSCSKENIPCHTDALGLLIDQKKSNLTCFVIEEKSSNVIKQLLSHGRVSYFCGLPSHEAYNFKGQFIEKIKLSSNELDISKLFRQSISELLLSFGMSEDGIKNMVGTPPDIGLKFHVEKIFQQTPGPDAGKEIEFI